MPNHSARALSTGRYGNIALIVPDIANPFFPPMIRAAQMEADRADNCIFLGDTDEDARQEEKLLTRFEGQVEGIVLAAPQLPDDRLRAHAEIKPLVIINHDVSGVPRVLIDSGPGVAEAIAHLVELGHRRLAYVPGPGSSWTNKQRRSAAHKAAIRHGLELVTISSAILGYEAGRRAVPELLRAGITGVLTFDDITAQGVIAGCSERGIRIPGGIAVLSCDGGLGTTTYPSLTAISNRSAEAGRVAVGLLLEMLNTRGVQDVRYVLDTYLVVRNTTGPHFKSSEPSA